MIKLIDAQSNAEIGEITEAQLQFLVDQLVEESASDTDYYINPDTLDYFASQAGDPSLITMLRGALGSKPDMDIRWVIT
jgi:processive 1,2-diacylglycerol beta-glucosyltransferase